MGWDCKRVPWAHFSYNPFPLSPQGSENARGGICSRAAWEAALGLRKSGKFAQICLRNGSVVASRPLCCICGRCALGKRPSMMAEPPTSACRRSQVQSLASPVKAGLVGPGLGWEAPLSRFNLSEYWTKRTRGLSWCRSASRLLLSSYTSEGRNPHFRSDSSLFFLSFHT